MALQYSYTSHMFISREKNKRENDSQDYFGRFTSTVKQSQKQSKNSQKWPKIAKNRLFLPKNPCKNDFTVLLHIPYVHINRKKKR